MTRTPILFVAAVSLLTGLADQSAPLGTPAPDGAISGRISAANGTSIGEALVTIWAIDSPANTQTRRQLTDDLGRFVFLGLRGGVSYGIRARKPGYLEGAFGRTKVEDGGETSISLPSGAWFDRANITLWPTASFAGRVLDESERPVSGVLVRLCSYRQLVGGKTVLVGGPFTKSDDQGRFSFEDLSPGDYFAMVPSGNWSDSGASLIGSHAGRLNGQFPLATTRRSQAPVVYPIVLSGNVHSPSDAQQTRLGVGQALDGADIQLRPVASQRVVGRVMLLGRGAPGIFMRLTHPDLIDSGLGAETAATKSGTDGSFEFVGVPAGEYVLDVPLSVNEYVFAGGSMSNSYGSSVPRPPGLENAGNDTLPGSVWAPGLSITPIRGATAWFRTRLVVDSTSTERPLEVVLTPALTLTGNVLVDVDPERPTPRTRPGVLWLEGDDVAHARFAAATLTEVPEGTFAFRAILPGSYYLRTAGSDWSIKSITMNGQDRTHLPLEVLDGSDAYSLAVTVTNASAELSGTVTGDSSGVVDIFLVPSAVATTPERLPSTVRITHATTGGTYRFARVPAGEYLVFALRDAAIRDWTPSAVASTLAAADRVILQWGKEVRKDVRDVSARVMRR